MDRVNWIDEDVGASLSAQFQPSFGAYQSDAPISGQRQWNSLIRLDGRCWFHEQQLFHVWFHPADSEQLLRGPCQSHWQLWWPFPLAFPLPFENWVSGESLEEGGGSRWWISADRFLWTDPALSFLPVFLCRRTGEVAAAVEVVHALHRRHCLRRRFGGRGAYGGSQNGTDAHGQKSRQRPGIFTYFLFVILVFSLSLHLFSFFLFCSCCWCFFIGFFFSLSVPPPPSPSSTSFAHPLPFLVSDIRHE